MAPSHLLSGEFLNFPLGKRPALRASLFLKPAGDETNKPNF
jgi:hypothetical protein